MPFSLSPASSHGWQVGETWPFETQLAKGSVRMDAVLWRGGGWGAAEPHPLPLPSHIWLPHPSPILGFGKVRQSIQDLILILSVYQDPPYILIKKCKAISMGSHARESHSHPTQAGPGRTLPAQEASRFLAALARVTRPGLLDLLGFHARAASLVMPLHRGWRDEGRVHRPSHLRSSAQSGGGFSP